MNASFLDAACLHRVRVQLAGASGRIGGSQQP